MRSGGSLSDLEICRVFGNVSVCSPDCKFPFFSMRRDRTYDPRAVSRPIPLYGIVVDGSIFSE
jgi:hypothetical protein